MVNVLFALPVQSVLNQPSSMHAIPTNHLGIIKVSPSLSPNSVSSTFGGIGPDRQGILMDALSRGLRTRRVLQQMQRENDERMRVTALSMAQGAGVELTEDEQGDLDV